MPTEHNRRLFFTDVAGVEEAKVEPARNGRVLERSEAVREARRENADRRAACGTSWRGKWLVKRGYRFFPFRSIMTTAYAEVRNLLESHMNIMKRLVE